MRPPDGVPRWVRPFVYGFLVVFVACGLAGIEAWPLSGFRLFSAPRSNAWTSYRVWTIGEDQVRRPLRVAGLPAAFRGLPFVAAGLGSMTHEVRAETCEALASAASSAGTRFAALQVVQVEHRALPRIGDRPAVPPRSTLLVECEPEHAPALRSLALRAG